jgi:hypothetical protein
MEQTEFKYRLNESTKKLIEFTQTLVKNSISSNVVYLIEPNNRDTSQHLNEKELLQLTELNKLDGQLFNTDEVVHLLYLSGLIPLWINTEIDRSNKSKTIIKLICSRRYRDTKDLNDRIDQFPPFHLLVPTPPWKKENKKFDINWQHQKVKRKWHILISKWRYKKELRKHKNTKS